MRPRGKTLGSKKPSAKKPAPKYTRNAAGKPVPLVKKTNQPAKPKSGATVLAGKGYAVPTNKPRSEVAKVFGPSGASASHRSGVGQTAASHLAKPSGAAASHKPKPRGPMASHTPTRPMESHKPTGGNNGNPGRPDGPQTRVTDAAKSPGRTTKKEAAVGKKYKALVVTARTTVNGKKMSDAEVRKIKTARKKLKKMRVKLTNSGYGSLGKNKKGGSAGHGIYKALTGKKLPPKKNKSTKPGR